jgi:hypothetical protein
MGLNAPAAAEAVDELAALDRIGFQFGGGKPGVNPEQTSQSIEKIGAPGEIRTQVLAIALGQTAAPQLGPSFPRSRELCRSGRPRRTWIKSLGATHYS